MRSNLLDCLQLLLKRFNIPPERMFIALILPDLGKHGQSRLVIRALK